MFVNNYFTNFPLYNSRIPRIKNTDFSGYHLYLNTNILGDFQICISVPLNSFLQRGDKIKKTCVLCNSKQHPPWRCSKYTNPSYKREFLKRNGLCYICFEKGHISSNCTMSYSCNKCCGKHSISLC